MVYGWQGIVLLAWLGLSVGSFLNVVIYRLPVMLERQWRANAREIMASESLTQPADTQEADQAPQDETAPFNLMVPRSRCPKCNHQIGALENIPVFSWLFLGRKCKACRAPISARYPAIELLTAGLTIAVITQFGFTGLGLALCFFTWFLIAATFIDFDTTLLPDQLTFPLLWLGLLTNTLTHGIVPLTDAVIGAVAGYLFLWGTYWLFKLATGKEGMGYGDFKLFAALGAWMGWQVLPSIILIAAVLGLLYAMFAMLAKQLTRAQPIAFGPYLAVAGWVTLMWREPVLSLFSIAG